MGKWIAAILCVLTLGSAALSARYGEIAQRAQELADAGNKQAAADLLESAIGRASDDEAEWWRATILTWRDSPDQQVVTQYLKVADTFPTSPFAAPALIHVGHFHDRMKVDSDADWQRVVKAYPGTKEAADAYHSLGHLAIRHRDPELAVRMFKQSADSPKATAGCAADSQVEAGYATISRYWKTKDKGVLKDAQETFQSLRAVTATTTPAIRAHLGLGEIFLIQGAAEDASREYQAALVGNPRHPYLLGIARFGLASALYTKHDYSAAAKAFTEFLDDRKGLTLKEKDLAWKQTRPGFTESAISGPAKGGGLTRADLVPTAAYWKAASLVEMKRYSEAKVIIDELKLFTGPRIASRVANLRKICVHTLGEDK